MGMDRCNRYWHLLPGGVLALMLVACGGGGDGDDKPVEPTLEAPNQLPTASFSAQANRLVMQFDGSASTDADGRIIGYRWNFGEPRSVVRTRAPSRSPSTPTRRAELTPSP